MWSGVAMRVGEFTNLAFGPREAISFGVMVMPSVVAPPALITVGADEDLHLPAYAVALMRVSKQYVTFQAMTNPIKSPFSQTLMQEYAWEQAVLVLRPLVTQSGPG